MNAKTVHFREKRYREKKRKKRIGKRGGGDKERKKTFMQAQALPTDLSLCEHHIQNLNKNTFSHDKTKFLI